MKILILGADGMLGHELVSNLSVDHEVHAVLRRPPSAAVAHALDAAIVHVGFDARVPNSAVPLLASVRPEAVVNCAGIVKQRQEATHPLESIRVNALFPQELVELCQVARTRMIHLSTDCVFSGAVGAYREHDVPDPLDLYGRSKLLGEVAAPPATTLRTSIIGLELTRHDSLVEWFLRQRGRIAGYTNAIYSGVTTMEMSRCVRMLLTQFPDLSGLWHVAADPIDKYSLLIKLATALDRADVEIVPESDPRCDRSLIGTRFTTATGYAPPTWDDMLHELAIRIRQREARTA